LRLCRLRRRCLPEKKIPPTSRGAFGGMNNYFNSVKIAHSHNKAKATKTKTAGKSARREPSDKKPTN